MVGKGFYECGDSCMQAGFYNVMPLFKPGDLQDSDGRISLI